MSNSFFALLFRQKYIRRWGLMRNVSDESLISHIAETAMLAHALAIIGNRLFQADYHEEKIALLALYHDATEVYTGDMPTPVKYFNDEIRRSYRQIEDNAAALLLSKLPDTLQSAYQPWICETDISPEEAKLVKAADKLSAYIKCIEEEKSGNPEFRQARLTTEAALDAMDCPELDWFREHLLPSFFLTLDEL